MNAKQAARAVTPPLLWELARCLKSGQPKPEAPRPTVFTGPIASWAEALRQSDGWDAPPSRAKLWT